MTGISESKFKPIETNFQFSINHQDQHNPEYQFSFKDISYKNNHYGLKQWRQRARSTRHNIISNKNQLNTLQQNNIKLQEIVKTQRRQIDKLKSISKQHTTYHNPNTLNIPRCNQYSDSRIQHSSKMKYKYQAEHHQSPVVIKPFSNTPSTLNYRNDSPGYAQIYSKRMYGGQSRLVNRDQEEIYKLKINNLNEMIEYLKRERELVENQYTIKDIEYKGYIMSLELKIKQQEENKEKQIEEIITQIKEKYQYHLNQTLKANRNKQLMKQALLSNHNKKQNNLMQCQVINISLSPIQSNQFASRALSDQLLRQRQIVIDLKNKLKQQSSKVNQQAKRIMHRFQEDIHNDSTPEYNNDEIISKLHFEFKQQQFKSKIDKLEKQVIEIKSRHQLQIRQYQRMNEELSKKYDNREIEVILLQQKLNIQQCYKSINNSQKQNSLKKQEKWEISEIPEHNHKEQNQVESKYQSQTSTIIQVKELKQIIEQKDMNIAMLIQKYEKIQAKLLQVISFNHQVNNMNKLIINQRTVTNKQ